jgi:hypothetical protein
MIVRKLTVFVWGKAVDITVHQKSKSVWIARGDHLGESIEVKSQSATSAAKLWAETAKYRSN